MLLEQDSREFHPILLVDHVSPLSLQNIMPVGLSNAIHASHERIHITSRLLKLMFIKITAFLVAFEALPAPHAMNINWMAPFEMLSAIPLAHASLERQNTLPEIVESILFEDESPAAGVSHRILLWKRTSIHPGDDFPTIMIGSRSPLPIVIVVLLLWRLFSNSIGRIALLRRRQWIVLSSSTRCFSCVLTTVAVTSDVGGI